MLRWIGLVWRTFTYLSVFVVVGAAFVLGVSYLSQGRDAVIVIDGPPESPDFTIRDTPAGPRQTLSVVVGGTLDFYSRWHIAEGGCERRITSTLSQDTDEGGFKLVQMRRGQVFSVGKPGRYHVARQLPLGATPGLWHYKAEGVAICAFRTLPPVTYADFDVLVTDPNGPVVIVTQGPKLVSDRVPIGGPLGYRISYERLEARPSEVLNTFTTIGETPSGTPDVVLDRRPTAGLGIGKHIDIDISTTLPPDVHAGRWQMRQVIVTERPGGKTRYDPQFSIEFEVMP